MKITAALSVLALAAASGLAGCGTADHLDLSVTVTEGILIVRNQSDEVGKDCLIQVNDRYEMNVHALGANKGMPIALADLTDDSGQRFNPSTHRVKGIFVVCREPLLRTAAFKRD